MLYAGVGCVNNEKLGINFTDVLKAPRNAGPVYVTSQIGTQTKSYKNNPIVVGNSDIQGIDIAF
ncbi:MAG: hypothetical protein PHQ84_04140 [Candidatus Omnitrophica bacterium]|nr:hypothetical protein [Candidatus Omnitrophota bacterium]MDD5078177.1 hypothetical protein [Candidatus Omnitrophota bacterium]